jgi:D-alanyl-D-alanine carboxypeptidase
MLPESGKSGTFKNAFNGLNGKIHAKTASMSHVYNLSGYLGTNSGKTLLPLRLLSLYVFHLSRQKLVKNSQKIISQRFRED